MIPSRIAKFYAVGRADLPAGLRAAQIGHALIAHVLAHGRPPDNLVLLEVPDEEALLGLLERLQAANVTCTPFTEPDLDNEHTAIAVSPDGRRLLSRYPLLLRS